MSETTIDTRPTPVQRDQWQTCECGARYTGSHDCGGMVERNDNEPEPEGCWECGHTEFDMSREDRAIGHGTVDGDGDVVANWTDTEYGTAYALCTNCGAEWNGDIY